jgi:DNA polymerase-3 subunit gamma/tau
MRPSYLPSRLELLVSTGPSLYRRHRPRTFADVVGQEHVVRTLSNAVERGKVHHAYLFVGSRGTGKTSMAKILAACLNCEGDPPTTPSHPTITPCGHCESCIAIQNATSLDVIEMDAASNNSVDDIRDLREKVAYAPVSGRHKVYILDEAHMLSQQAWNAFLKTLEEPPPRTIFVLATTEAQKVLPTVVDRCHRFDFGRPSVEQVATVLAKVAAEEQIDIDDGALALIARNATGSFRDALGTLEQLVTYAGDERIQAADVLAVLGVADAEQLFAAVDAIVARDPAEALRAAARLAESGRDPGQVLRDLEVHGCELLTVQVLEEVPPELRVTPERDRRLVEQAKTLAETDAVRLLDLVSAALEATANGAQARIQLELVLIKAAAPEVDPSVAALLARIERLESAHRATPDGSARPAPAPASEVPKAETTPDALPASREPPAIVVSDVWPAVIARVRERNAMLAHALAGTRPVSSSDRDLVVAFPAGAEFNKRKAEQEEHRRLVVDAVRQLTGQPLVVRYELGKEKPSDPAPLSDDDVVQHFIEEFDAQEIIHED